MTNAFGTAADLSEKVDGHPCQGEKVKIAEEAAIEKAKAEDAKNNGAGNC